MTTFASLNDLALLLGNESEDDLTAAQTAQGTMLLELATSVLTGQVGKDDDWAADLDPIPGILRLAVLAMVQPAMQNPTGARSESETLGAYSHTTSYTDGAHGLAFLDGPTLLACRHAVWGRLSGTSMPATTVDLIIELAETGEIAEFPAL
jgi:hypothetical protein